MKLKLKSKETPAPTGLRLKSKTPLQLKSRGDGHKISAAELETRHRITLAAKEQGVPVVIACLGHGYYSGKHEGEHTWTHFPDYADRFNSLKEANTALAPLPSYAGVVIDSKLPYLS